jgi:hypothetical protein
MVATVDFDHDIHLGSGESVGQHLYSFGGVDTNQQIDLLGQRAQPGGTHSGGPHWVGDEQVGEARVSENLASPTVATVRPTAPSASWRRAISKHLCVLACGRRVKLWSRARSAIATRLASNTSRSTTRHGV